VLYLRITDSYALKRSGDSCAKRGRMTAVCERKVAALMREEKGDGCAVRGREETWWQPWCERKIDSCTVR
jgi:hypothetical protein